MLSSPAPPSSRSLPSPPTSPSAPSFPSTTSSPSPAQIRSSPSPPSTVSFPCSASITSCPLVPTSESLPGVPTIVARVSRHVAAGCWPAAFETPARRAASTTAKKARRTICHRYPREAYELTSAREATLGPLAPRIHRAGRQGGRVHLLPGRRGRGRGRPRRPSRPGGVRAPEQVPVRVRPPDGRALPARRGVL